MVDNGSNGGAGALPRSESHDEFLELCALATTEALSAEERRRLEDHLPMCADCRTAIAQYEAMIGKVVPVLGSEFETEKSFESDPHWSVDEAEKKLFARLNAAEGSSSETVPGKPRPSGQRKNTSRDETLWRHVWWQFAAGLLLVVALGFSVYRMGLRKGAESAGLRLPVQAVAESFPKKISTPAPTSGQNEQSSAQIAALRKQVDEGTAEIARLKALQAQTAKELDGKESDRSRLEQERSDLAQQLETAQSNLQSMQQKLDSATGQDARDTERLAALQDKFNALTESVRDQDQEIARERELLDHDRDIRELMGSRDLYLAEVYDIAKTGDTQKPFGRVFYTKGKSLIFYAYDLDQQPGIKNANAFQAWGRRGPDRSHAVNLGMFYQDNANKKRWVLKSSDPQTLAQIDAVFVTVEPNGGSQHPSGKPLLFAYLRIEPNHP